MARDVPFVDLARQHAALAGELDAAVHRVFESSGFVLGREVEAFEAVFADYCGTVECVGVASGTAALELTFRALGIGRGDEVIVPAHTFIASALGVLHAGARPVLCDVDEATGLIDPASAEAAITERTAAILVVHLYGQAVDTDALGALAARRSLALVEDAAQAHGARWRGRPAGSLGTAACFSFYPSKNLGALGDGGAICTDDEQLATRARALRDLGQLTKGEHLVVGRNERLDGLQAALLGVKLAQLDAWNEARRAHAARYRAGLPEAFRPLPERDGAEDVFHLFPVRVADPAATGERLRAMGVATGRHYAPAIHGHPAMDGQVGTPVPLERSERWAAQELSLPMFAELTDEEVDAVVEACVAVT